jgi:uncharacterized repeat protein (TIGR03806 family)
MTGPYSMRGFTLSAAAALLAIANAAPASVPLESAAHGLDSGNVPEPYLLMPRTASGKMPALLSQTGIFKDIRHLVPSDGLIPYDLVVAFWSDGAGKQRWASIPAGGKIKFAPTGDWFFPAGSVLVKTFELPVEAAHPENRRRLETRVLVCDAAGGVYGVVYKWKADNSDAELLDSSLTEEIPIGTATGSSRQSWYYPSRQNCLECHNSHTTGVLGLKTRQMNRDYTYPSGITDNQLRTWNRLGLFDPRFSDADLADFPKLAAVSDSSRSLEDRARSYLDANCSQCHRPGGTVANFDARYDTPLAKQALIDGPVLIDERIDRSRVIAPNDIWRSIALLRVNTNGDIRMPPLARETIDEQGVTLLRQWITNLPGRPVVAPPQISPDGGTFNAPVEVALNDAEPGAEIRYTLDGSTPTASDPVYDKPIRITGPTVLRARAFKNGLTRSIAAQAVFIVGE